MALARMLAGQKRGRTTNIRHLLNKIRASASCVKSILTKTKTNKAKTTLEPTWANREKPLAGFILLISGLIY